MNDDVDREFRLAFWKIHILHHAAKQPIYGLWMLEELAEHGHRLSPGTLYPILARMEKRGWLRSDVSAQGQLKWNRPPLIANVNSEIKVAVNTLPAHVDRVVLPGET